MELLFSHLAFSVAKLGNLAKPTYYHMHFDAG